MTTIKEILVEMLACLPIDCAGRRHHEKPTDRVGDNYLLDLKKDMKSLILTNFDSMNYDPSIEKPDKVAADILSALMKVEKPGRDLDTTIQNIVNKAGGWHQQIVARDVFTQAGGWRERIAVAVVAALVKALKDTNTLMHQAMAEAYQKASDAAAAISDWAKEHPLYATALVLVIALGILIILTPYIIHALGFGIEGVVEGKTPP